MQLRQGGARGGAGGIIYIERGELVLVQRQLPAAAYCYVVDGASALQGVLNMRDLLLAPQETKVSEIMIRDVVKVSPFTDREELVAIAARRHYLAVPVTDANGRLIGAVNTKNIIASTEEEASEDLQFDAIDAGGADFRAQVVGQGVGLVRRQRGAHQHLAKTRAQAQGNFRPRNGQVHHFPAIAPQQQFRRARRR